MTSPQPSHPQSSPRNPREDNPVAPGEPVRVLRKEKKDRVIAGVAIAATVAACGLVWLGAPIRNAELVSHTDSYQMVTTTEKLPSTVAESWTVETHGPALPVTPQVESRSGLVLATSDHAVMGLNPSNGETIVDYHRDLDLCLGLVDGYGSLIAGYRTDAGCAEITAINAKKGNYRAQRADVAVTDPAPVASNDAVGMVDSQRLELWRSDLVRTIEYGYVHSPQEPFYQPTAGCRIDSVLTRSDLVAVIDVCPADVDSQKTELKPTGEAIAQPDGSTWWLRMMKRSPEDSRKPEFHASIPLAQPSHLIAIATDRAAIATIDDQVPLAPSAPGKQVSVYTQEGELSHQETAPIQFPAGVDDQPGQVYTPIVQDISHAMSFYDGNTLYLFRPSTLTIVASFPEAIGTPTDIGGNVVFPTAAGYTILDGYDNKVQATVPLVRTGNPEHVYLNVSGETIIEKRGRTLVGVTTSQ